MLNTFTAGFSRAAFNLDSSLLRVISAQALALSAEPGPAASSSAAASPRPGSPRITSAGPNNAAGVWNRRNLFTCPDGVQMYAGSHQISVGVWFQRLQDNEDTASRQLGAGHVSPA